MSKKVSGRASRTSRNAESAQREKHWQSSGAPVEYLVRLSSRAVRDLVDIFDFVESFIFAMGTAHEFSHFAALSPRSSAFSAPLRYLFLGLVVVGPAF